MRLPKLRELAEAFRAIFKGPYTRKFPKAPSPAFPRYRGIIVFDKEKCIGCGACVEVCPALAREMIDDKQKKIRKNIHYQDRCVYCGQCVAYCTNKYAIVHTTEYDLAHLDRSHYDNVIELELVMCEVCGEVITTRNHLRWIANKVGELAFANPTLMLIKLGELGLVEETTPRSEPAPYRSDTQRLLCPRCRREMHLTEVWGY